VLAAMFLASIPSSAVALGAQTAALRGVTCPTAATCIAVGSSRDAQNNAQPVVARSDGATWSFRAVPVPPVTSGLQARRGLLSSVACPTVSRCFAVGNYNDGVTNRTLIEQWDGAKWSIVSRLRPASARQSVLTGISCPTSSACLAVGSWVTSDSVTKALAVRWNANVWSIVTTPREDSEVRQSRLTGISCVSEASCFAVGTFSKSRILGLSLTERWDGTRWHVVASPNPDRLGYVVLAGVSCATANACLNVGFAASSIFESRVYEPLPERWTGTRWLIVPSPTPAAPSTITLAGVSCPAADSCFAVGERIDIKNQAASHRPVLEHWDGKTLSVMTGALDSTRGLSAISCRSRASCVAVGGTGSPLIARWNGASWSIAS
jgi:hypothetical protein